MRTMQYIVVSEPITSVKIHDEPHTVPAGLYRECPTDPREREAGLLWIVDAQGQRHLISPWEKAVTSLDETVVAIVRSVIL